MSPQRKGLAAALVAVTLVLGGVAWQIQGVGHLAQAQVAGPAINTPADSAAQQQATGLSRAFRKASEVILPTVVTIETRTKAPAPKENRKERDRSGNGQQFRGENPFKGTPFEGLEDFFGDNGNGMPGPRFHFDSPRSAPRHSGTGSGVIIDPSGIILTNNHVVEGAGEVTVRLHDGREFEATDIKTDPQTDLAVVRIKGAGTLPAARMGDSNALEIGDWVIAVGNPFGLDSTVSAGIISGKGRELGAGQRTRFLQTDAAINPGNSGGPLVNLDGEVIGINTAIASNSGGYQGIGFAIPINLAKWVTNQLVSTGSVRRAYLGVRIEQVNHELAEKFGVKRGDGVLVAEILPDSPAAAAGFKEGDVITEFAGVKVHGPRDLQEVVEQTKFDTKQTVHLMRDGKPMTLEVVVKAMPDNTDKQARSRSRGGDSDSNEGYFEKDLGLHVTDMSADLAEKLGFENFKGVLVSEVTPDSLAAEAGIREGMLILKVGNRPVSNVEEFKAAMKDQSVKNGVMFHVRTEGGNRFVVTPKVK
jgi:serine protease Do